HFIPSGKARAQGPCKTQRRGARVCSGEEEGESRYGSGSIGCFDQAALRYRHSSDDCDAGDEKKTTLAGGRDRERSSLQATIRYRRCTRMCASRHGSTASRLPALWNESTSMEWRPCFQAARSTRRSSSTHHAWRG